MTAHPLLLAMLVVEAAGCLLICLSGAGAVRILSGWAKETASEQQLRLERLAETVAMMTRAGLLLAAAALLLFVIAVSVVLPRIVPGAMCGTGVMQGMGPAGPRVLYSQGALLGLLLIWRLLARLDGTRPISVLTPVMSRLLILAAPVSLVAAVHLLSAVRALDIHTPVDCCATVYSAAALAVSPVRHASAAALVAGTAFLSGVLVFAAAAIIRRPLRRRAALLAAPASLGFAVTGWLALLIAFSPYHYGVLAHYCSWCLFVAEHRFVGWPLFAALGAVPAEGAAILIASAVGRRYETLAKAAEKRVQHGARGLLAALAVFLLLTFGAALLWRLRFGVWMSG